MLILIYSNRIQIKYHPRWRGLVVLSLFLKYEINNTPNTPPPISTHTPPIIIGGVCVRTHVRIIPTPFKGGGII